jgi:adenylate cyclase
VLGVSADRNVDLERADELASKGLALDPNNPGLHEDKGFILLAQGHIGESIAEFERELALDPSKVPALGGLASDYLYLGQFEKSLEFYDKAIRVSPRDPALGYWYNGTANDYFRLKQYEQTIQAARRAIAINPSINPWPYLNLIAALALSGHETGAHEALENYRASIASGPKTIAAFKAYRRPHGVNEVSDPRSSDFEGRMIDGLRRAGMPEE